MDALTATLLLVCNKIRVSGYEAHAMCMSESEKFSKFQIEEIQIINLHHAFKILLISSLNGQLSLNILKMNQRSQFNLLNSVFSVESQPQNPDFKSNPENCHPCKCQLEMMYYSLTFVCYLDEETKSFM